MPPSSISTKSASPLDVVVVGVFELPDATGTVLTTGNSNTPTTATSSGDADFVLVDDGGTMKRITPSNPVSYTHLTLPTILRV